MTETLYAGAARRVVNPPLGTRQTGFRLFGNPVQAIESDLTATALVLGDGRTKVVVIAIDLSIVGIDISLRNQRPAQAMRPCPLRLPVTSATTPSVSRVGSSGWSPSPKRIPGTSSKARPTPFDRR